MTEIYPVHIRAHDNHLGHVNMSVTVPKDVVVRNNIKKGDTMLFVDRDGSFSLYTKEQYLRGISK